MRLPFTVTTPGRSVPLVIDKIGNIERKGGCSGVNWRPQDVLALLPKGHHSKPIHGTDFKV